MISKLTQLLTKLKYKLYPKSNPSIPSCPIEQINVRDKEYKKTHWV